jgi:hypothetical protein
MSADNPRRSERVRVVPLRRCIWKTSVNGFRWSVAICGSWLTCEEDGVNKPLKE